MGSRPFKPYDFPILGDKLYGITDLTYIAKVLQVTLYGGPAHAAMVIADAIDDLFNLDFLEFIPKDMKSGRIAGYVSRALYSIQELGDRVPELEQPVKEICGAVIEKYHIRKNLVQRRLTGLYEVKHLHGQDPESLEVIKNHIRALGSENLINMI